LIDGAGVALPDSDNDVFEDPPTEYDMEEERNI